MPRNGILVIFDEVLTGFGRTGTFFAMDQLTDRPDIVCLSKGLTAGMMPGAVTAATGRFSMPFRERGEDVLSWAYFHGQCASVALSRWRI